MVKCSNCNEIYHENADYCPNCGTEKMKVEEFIVVIKETSRTLSESSEIIIHKEERYI